MNEEINEQPTLPEEEQFEYPFKSLKGLLYCGKTRKSLIELNFKYISSRFPGLHINFKDIDNTTVHAFSTFKLAFDDLTILENDNKNPIRFNTIEDVTEYLKRNLLTAA